MERDRLAGLVHRAAKRGTAGDGDKEGAAGAFHLPGDDAVVLAVKGSLDLSVTGAGHRARHRTAIEGNVGGDVHVVSLESVCARGHHAPLLRFLQVAQQTIHQIAKLTVLKVETHCLVSANHDQRHKDDEEGRKRAATDFCHTHNSISCRRKDQLRIHLCCALRPRTLFCMPRVVHFEIHATRPEALIDFYTSVFSWKFVKWDGPAEYWLIGTGDDQQPGINGGLVKRMGDAPVAGAPVNAYVCTVDVEAIDDYVHRVLASGGTIAVPKMPVPGIGWLAYGKDPDGNIFGIMQTDGEAK